MKIMGFSVVVFSEGRAYTSWCPELDVASQGKSVEKALSNLKEAVTLHLESLSENEISRMKSRSSHRLLTTIEVPAPA